MGKAENRITWKYEIQFKGGITVTGNYIGETVDSLIDRFFKKEPQVFYDKSVKYFNVDEMVTFMAKPINNKEEN